MMQMDLFAVEVQQPLTKPSLVVGDKVRVKPSVLEEYERKREYESYYYLIDAKGIGVVKELREDYTGGYAVVDFGKITNVYVKEYEVDVI